MALLRGINVGGKNLIRMPDLADSFRDAGYADVRTYMQSGNVLFRASGHDGPNIEARIERMLERRFGMPLLVVIRSRDEIAQTIHAAPADHASPSLRSDVFFLRYPLTAEEALADLPELREGGHTGLSYGLLRPTVGVRLARLPRGEDHFSRRRTVC